MVWTSLVALIIAQGAEAGPWEKYGEVIGHTLEGESGSVLTIQYTNVERHNSGAFTAWIEGDHSKDASVPYRRSITKVFFDCKGNYRTTATTHYDASGAVSYSWDGYGQSTSLRPYTIYHEFAERICA